MLNKRANIDNLASIVTGLGIIAILIAVIFLVIGEAKTQVISIAPCDNSSFSWNTTDSTCVDANGVTGGFSTAYNSTVVTQDAASDIPGWIPLIVLVMIAGVILAIVRTFRQI